MKNLFLIMVTFFLSLSAMGMKPLSDEALSGVSGQSGVSFYVDVTLNIHVDTLAWGDSDGLAPGPYNPWGIQTSGGYVGAANLSITGLRISSYIVSSSPGSVSFWPSPCAIDIFQGQPYYRIDAGPGIK